MEPRRGGKRVGLWDLKPQLDLEGGWLQEKLLAHCVLDFHNGFLNRANLENHKETIFDINGGVLAKDGSEGLQSKNQRTQVQEPERKINKEKRKKGWYFAFLFPHNLVLGHGLKFINVKTMQ